MKIYLDTCSLQRPFDDRSQMRIALEAQAILEILQFIANQNAELISSEALEFEIRKIMNVSRKEILQDILKNASTRVLVNDSIELRARGLIAEGIKPLDALHLASAESVQVDFFCTCDDRFLKKAKAVVDLACKPVSPIELIEDIDND